MYQHQILKNVLSICTLSIFYACPLIQSLLTSWEEMRDRAYSLFNGVWLYRMTWWDDMVSCAPGQLPGAVGGFMPSCTNRQTVLLKVHWVHQHSQF